MGPVGEKQRERESEGHYTGVEKGGQTQTDRQRDKVHYFQHLLCKVCMCVRVRVAQLILILSESQCGQVSAISKSQELQIFYFKGKVCKCTTFHVSMIIFSVKMKIVTQKRSFHHQQ